MVELIIIGLEALDHADVDDQLWTLVDPNLG